MKRLFGFVLVFMFLLFFVKTIYANQVSIQLFSASGCPHCAKEKIFLGKLIKKYPEITFKDYEITKDKDNYDLLEKTARDLNVDIQGVPFTIVGDKYFFGYHGDETTGKEIEDIVKKAIGKTESITDNKTAIDLVTIPIFGEINVKTFSLPLLTILVALLDGFNPCAMWTLLFLISLLLGIQDRKRVWLLGTTFIVSSAFVYYLFLSAWLNLFLFLGFVSWVRLAIGFLALVAGIYYLYDYLFNKNGGCAVVGDTKRQRVFDTLRSIIQQRSLLLSMVGISLLAIAVNLIELICSAGLPAIYTKVLSLSHLSPLQYHLYLLLYVFVFMVDDLVIFFTAMLTLQMVGIQKKYSKISRLVGGIITVIIGLLLIFRPELLMF